MMTQEELTAYVHQKLKTGYTDQEIKTELVAQGYNEADISNAMYLFEEKKKPARNPLTILVSIIFIVLGIWRISSGMQIWGTILLAYGAITLVIRMVQLGKE